MNECPAPTDGTDPTARSAQAATPARIRRGPRGLTVLAAVAIPVLTVATWSWTPGCGGQPPAGPSRPADPSAHPAPTDTLLVVDGITVTFADVAEPVAYFDRILPQYDERLKIQKVLTQFTLPLLFARREFAAQRQQQLELARTLRQSSGNVAELDRNSIERSRRRAFLVPTDIDPPLAAFLFDDAQIGAVSPPIELPQGFVLASAFDVERGSEVLRDRCDALLVHFLTHPANLWAEWLAALRTRIADRVTFVHPDYHLALPPWMKLP